MDDTLCSHLRLSTLRGVPLDPRSAEHLTICARCAHEREGLRALGIRLRAVAPDPPVTLRARTLHLVAPALAHNADHVLWRPLLQAVGVALLPLPVLIVTGAYALRALYALLATVLPESVSLYLVLNYASLLALLAAVTYGAVPVLAARQARHAHEVVHG